jgi:hypothetical protein
MVPFGNSCRNNFKAGVNINASPMPDNEMIRIFIIKITKNKRQWSRLLLNNYFLTNHLGKLSL